MKIKTAYGLELLVAWGEGVLLLEVGAAHVKLTTDEAAALVAALDCARRCLKLAHERYNTTQRRRPTPARRTKGR